MNPRDWVEYYDHRARTLKDPLMISEMVLRGRSVDREFLRREGRRIAGLLQADRGETLLDLGCCAGVCLSMVARHFKTSLGVDLAADALRVASKHLPRSSFIQDDITLLLRIPSRSQLFVTVYGVLHYMKPADQTALFRAVARVCKKGARVALMRIPNADHHEEYQEWRASLGKKTSGSRDALHWSWVSESFVSRHTKTDFDMVSILPPSDTGFPLRAFFDILLFKKT